MFVSSMEGPLRYLIRALGACVVVFCTGSEAALAYDASTILNAWEDACLKNAADPERLEAAAKQGQWPSALDTIQGPIRKEDREILGLWLYRSAPEPILLLSIRSSSDGTLQHQCEIDGEVDDPENLRELVETKFDVKLRPISGGSLEDLIYYHPLQYDGRGLSLTLIWSKSVSDRLVKLNALYRADGK